MTRSASLPIFALCIALVGCGASTSDAPTADANVDADASTVDSTTSSDVPIDAPRDAVDASDARGCSVDGTYCGDALGLDDKKLYACSGGVAKPKAWCGLGCTHGSAPGTDLCAPPHRGVWIWNFFPTSSGPAHSPSPVDTATMFQKLGVSYVAIKAGQDGDDWNWNYNDSVVNEFTSRGIDVYAWWYLTPSYGTVSSKLDAMTRVATMPATKGMFFDTETEFFGHAADATAFCTAARARFKSLKIGYNPEVNWTPTSGSYQPQTFWPDFPWKEFDTGCGDFVAPQIYWTEFTPSEPVSAWNWYATGAAKLGLKAPIWGLQDSGDFHHPTAVQLNAFFSAAADHAAIWRTTNPTGGDAWRNDVLWDVNFKSFSAPADLGKCTSPGVWCGHAPGAPAGAEPNALYSCAAKDADWVYETTCPGSCYVCPSGVPDTCSPSGAAAHGCK